MRDQFESQHRALHREIWNLLPWHVNGTLSERQAGRVEKHLAECAECRSEHASQQALQQHLREEDSVVQTPHASLRKLMARIEQVTVDYLAGQVEAGAEALQLFDSWSGSLAPAEFERWVIAPNAAIVSALRERHPGTPIIGFPKGAGGKLPAYAREVRPDALGLDETVDPLWADASLPNGLPVQGNLDPLALMAGGEALETAVDRILTAFQSRPHIFNLGHGILQHTPIAHVEKLLNLIRMG